MKINVNKLNSINNVVSFWSICLKDLGKRDDSKIAYDMVRVGASAHWNSWYNESQGDPLLVETFDLAADLETPIERQTSRAEMWRQIKQNVAALEHKYPI